MYDVVFNLNLEKNREQSERLATLASIDLESGIPANRIVLAGFSQGGVIALHLAPRFGHKLAGVLALSTYMCEPDLLAKDAIDINRDTPIMMAHGEQDEVVPVFMGNAAYNTLKENNFDVTWQTYTMQHNVCMQEIRDISSWLQKLLA